MLERLMKLELPATKIIAAEGDGKGQTQPKPDLIPEEDDLNKKQQQSGTTEREKPLQKDGDKTEKGENGKQKAAGV